MPDSLNAKDRVIKLLAAGETKHATDPSAQSGGISYTIDKTDTIIAVSSKWDDFAGDNDGEKVLSSNILGRKLDQFIHGDVTLMFVRTMIMSARTLRRPIYRPYRCDSPKLKRFMEMIVLPREDGAVEVLHRELHSEPIANLVHLVAVPAASSTAYIKRCSMCNRVLAKGVWSEIDDAIKAKRLQVDAPSLKVIYGLCPDCISRRGMIL